MASEAYQKYKMRNQKLGRVQWVEILGMLKIGRILRLNTMIQLLKSGEDIKAGLRVLKITLFLIVYLHCLACLWWLIVKTDRVWVPPKDIYHGDFYYVYRQSLATQYMYSLQVSVWTMIGCDNFPRTTFQSMLSAICLFIGAVINANLFGELSLLLAGMNHGLKRFQMKINRANTVMIDLKLPSSL